MNELLEDIYTVDAYLQSECDSLKVLQAFKRIEEKLLPNNPAQACPNCDVIATEWKALCAARFIQDGTCPKIVLDKLNVYPNVKFDECNDCSLKMSKG
jgi:hypothetical protein